MSGIRISYNAALRHFFRYVHAMPAHDNQVPFQTHVALLQFFLIHRTPVVERIRGILSAEQKPVEFQQDRALLGR
ncbi:MAG: hypothetical protein ABI645_08205, partial [Pseudomonadota bacterium]